MDKLRVGVIGLGMGRAHVAGYQSHPRAEVVAVADLDGARLEQVAAQYSVRKRYTSAEAMLEQEHLDVVSVATPNKSHMQFTVAALQAGCHVLCEKPMAMNAAEARQMLHAARKAGRRLMINFSFRFTDVALALREHVDAGHLGEPYFARTVWHRRRGIPGLGGWFTTKALSGGGPLIDLGVHRIDLALWFMGYPRPVWVMGSTYDLIGRRLARESGKSYDVEDLAVALVRFENGATLVAEASWAANIAEAELMETRVLGTEGGLLYRNVGEGYEFEAEFYTGAHGEVAREKIRPTGQAKGSAHHFIDSIITGTPHIATGEEGLIVMELLDAIYRSAETGEPVRISPA